MRRSAYTGQVHHTSPSLPLLALLANAVATAGALVGLILAFGAVSDGHFNPLITTLQWLSRERNLRCTIAYCVAQMVGAVLGAFLANWLFGQPLIPNSMNIAPPAQLVGSE
jgi:glycerol uptake facilitator-like aquaporin